jgi:branched-chain amino acid transport system ATP-binding protein
VIFEGQVVSGLPSYKIAARGVCLVPEHRGIFKLLTVEENLTMAARKESPGSWTTSTPSSRA